MDAQPSQVISLITNTISPLAGLTINFDWVNLYRHNSHYDPAKCQWCRPCCDGLFRGLLKLWHFLANDCIIWVEGEACHRIANWFIKKGWFFLIQSHIRRGCANAPWRWCAEVCFSIVRHKSSNLHCHLSQPTFSLKHTLEEGDWSEQAPRL